MNVSLRILLPVIFIAVICLVVLLTWKSQHYTQFYPQRSNVIQPTHKRKRDSIAEYKSSLDRINSTKELENVYYKLITENAFVCANSLRIGRVEDGGWNVCLTKEFKPGTPCYMYSFGINNIWEFDDIMSSKYKCQVRAFDPSMNVAPHKRNANLWFFNYGLAGKDETRLNGWKMFTYESLLKKFNHSNTVIDILKFDVDFAEWEAMEHMIKSGVLKKVKQLMLETHTDEVYLVNRRTTSKNYRRYMLLWKQISALGFRQWYNHLNPAGMYVSQNTGIKRTCCYEHYLVNTNFI